MIRTLGHLAQTRGSKAFFYAQMSGGAFSFSYRQTRVAAAALARELEKRGVVRGGYVACNMYNGPEFVFLALAAAYGGFTLAVLNPRLSESEQLLRKIELETATHQRVEVLTEDVIRRMIIDATGVRVTDLADNGGNLIVTSRVMNILDYAAVCEQQYNPNEVGIIMFTSGTSGTPKATQLTWNNLLGSAKAAAKELMKPRKGVWQLVLPMCHIGGFQVMVRSLINESQFILYEHYSPSRILNDVLSYKVTHISVVDKILDDLLEGDHDRIISMYNCILIGGAALNDKTIRKAHRRKAKVFASYGMTETSSMIACSQIGRNFDGWLKVLPGYQVRALRPDKHGMGQLQVQGPGIFAGYLNARSANSADGWFVTGDNAMVKGATLKMGERTEDLIISGGENIYPAEVRHELVSLPGVKDAYVFGTEDETWGYRPVAFIEADYSAEAIARDHAEAGLDPEKTGIKAASCPQEFARMLHHFIEDRMSHLHHPKHILVMNEFPRTTIGKVDALALRKMYDYRIDIKNVALYRVAQPLAHPITTSQTTVEKRESFFVEVTDWAGRRGIAECVSFTTDWYLPETIDDDYRMVKTHIAPLLMTERYLHPSEVSRSFATFPLLSGFPMAQAAVEPAIWDLYGKITGKSLAELINEGFAAKMAEAGKPQEQTEVPGVVAGGAVVGILDEEATLAAVDKAVEAGYTRVKIKISPESFDGCFEAVREKYPDLTLVLDANQSFTESDMALLEKVDAIGAACIEEPLDPSYAPHESLFARLSRLQDSFKTPICLDESVVTAEDMIEAMGYTNLRSYVVKIAKFGGIQPALNFCVWAAQHGVSVWMGGMFDTGVSKRMHAAFETLPIVTLPGDINDFSSYFEHDCALPELVLQDGKLELNVAGREAGLGARLNKDYLQTIRIEEPRVIRQ